MEFGFVFVDTKKFNETSRINHIKTEHKPCPHTAEKQHEHKCPNDYDTVFAHSGTKISPKNQIVL